ncbi:MAG: DUF4412 domain-containing protein [Ignavibacteriales bacterium]|nr:MAG: DUF4412 domain-containing protein [Ignavibacteriales bacterium]
MITLKNLSCFILLLISAFTATAFAQSDFEGKVVLKISDNEDAGDVDYFVKDNKMRMEMKSSEGSMVMLFDKAAGKTFMIMPEQKMYMEFNAMDIMQNNDISVDSESNPDINRTGEYMDINGYTCEKWIVKEDDEIVEAWMTDELGGFFLMSNPMAGSQDSWQQELAGNFFPMRVDMIEGAEKKKVLEVLSVNEMSLNNDLFEIPSGFQKFDMPNMNMDKQK